MIVRDLMGKNICCQIRRDQSVDLVVIDGVGHRDFIPLVDWIPFFTGRKINRIYQKKQLQNVASHRIWLSNKYPSGRDI